MAGVHRVHIRHADGDWSAIETDERNATKATFELPETLLRNEGFLQVSPFVEDLVSSLVFVVGDPGLPSSGTGLSVLSVDPQELGPGGRLLTVTGAGFEEGVSAVLGRGEVSVPLPTDVWADDTLGVELPPAFLGRGEDLSLSVVSEDRQQRSALLAVRSTESLEGSNPAAILAPGERSIIGVGGPIIWDGGDNQELTLALVGPAEATETVLFQLGERELAAQALSVGSTTTQGGESISLFETQIPPGLTKWQPPTLRFRAHPGLRIQTAGTALLGALPQVNVPLGARIAFRPYKGGLDDPNIYLVPETDAAPYDCSAAAATVPSTRPTRYPGLVNLFRYTPVSGTKFNLPTPISPKANPFTGEDVPLMHRERDGCTADPNVLRLRGDRLSTKDPGTGEVNETVVIQAEYTEPLTGRVLRGSLKVFVGESVLNHQIDPSGTKKATLTAAATGRLDRLVLAAAGESGVPPQFLKGQAYHESGFDGMAFRYEPMTIDFEAASGNVPPTSGVLERDNTVWGPYIRRHLLEGSLVLPQPASSPAKCIVLAGPNSNPPDTIAGCTGPIHRVDLGALPARKDGYGPIPTLSADVAVHEYSGPPIRGKYTLNHDIVGTRYSAPDPDGKVVVTSLTRTEPRRKWTVAEGVIDGAKADPDEFQFIYPSNEVFLHKPLAEGEWIKLVYHEVETDELTADGACAVEPSTFDGRTNDDPPKLQFARGSIANWLTTNMIAKGGRYLNGTVSESNIEFYVDWYGVRTPKANRRRGPMDSRLKAATAQFVAAGSYGLLHATIRDWMWNSTKNTALNKAFSLDSKCLPALSSDDEAALRLGVASHSYHRKANRTKVPDPCSAVDGCTQQEWAQYWTDVIRYFNSGQPVYNRGKDGVSVPVRHGLRLYDAQ